jgi:hypothetical protein
MSTRRGNITNLLLPSQALDTPVLAARDSYNCTLLIPQPQDTQHRKAMASSDTASARPRVVLLTLNKAEFFGDMYGDFITLLKTKAEVQQITTPEEARSAFNDQPKPAAILSADESLLASTRISLVHDALSYVRAGGILVFMGLFSSFSRPSDIKTLFSRFDLPWESGDYHRSTFKLNREMTHFNKSGLAGSYSQKALHLANVTFDDAVYLPSNDSVVESNVFGPRRVGDRTQTPAAFTKIGEGKVGYVGDVNNEDETSPLVLGMCGL